MNEETPKRNFQGTWAPTLLHDLVENGSMTPTAAWLVLVISSLSRTKQGCFASNEFLGQKIHRTGDHVKDLLKVLEKYGLLKSRWEGKTRRLWIDWSGESKSKRQRSYKSESKNRLSQEGGLIPEREDLSPLRGRIYHPLEGGSITPIVLVNENSKIGGSPPGGFSSKEESHSWAKELRTILRTKIPPLPISNGSIEYWAKDLKSLWSQLGKDSGRIVKLLNGYEKYINKIDRPTITNAKQFCQHFVWLEEEVKKLEDAESLPEGKIRRKIKRKYHRDVKRITNPETGAFTLDTLRKEVTVDQIGEKVEGDDCRTRTVWEDNGYPFLTDKEGNVWTRDGVIN